MAVMYPDDITVWHRNKDVNHKASWTRTCETGRISEVVGATATVNGDSSDNAVLALIPCPVERSFQRGDKISRGVIEQDTPTKGAYTVTRSVEVHLDATPHHWEVSASERTGQGI